MQSCDRHGIAYSFAADKCPLCEADKKPALLTFEVLAYNGGPSHAPNRVTGREFVRRRDLSAAIKWASRRMLASKGELAGAHGFYVQVVRPGSHSAYIYTARTGRELEA